MKAVRASRVAKATRSKATAISGVIDKSENKARRAYIYTKGREKSKVEEKSLHGA